MTFAQLDRRLRSYSVAAGAAVAGAATAEAAIVYVDVPDVVVNDVLTEYLLDLNGDAVNDFRLERDSFYYGFGPSSWSQQTFINAVNLNTQGTEGTYGDGYLRNPIIASSGFAKAVAAGAGISAADPGWTNGWPHLARGRESSYMTSSRWWTNPGGTSTPGYYTTNFFPVHTGPNRYGPWHGQGERFLGLAVYIGGNLHYGWARCAVAADLSSLTILDYAYQDVPGAGIIAGDVGSTASPGREMQASANAAGIQGDQFNSKPKIYGFYNLPVFGDLAGDGNGVAPKKATAKVLDKPTADDPLGTIGFEWTKKVKLYDAAAFKAGYKAGTIAAEQALTQTALPVDLQLDSKQLDNPADIPDIALQAPTIGGVFDVTGTKITGALPGTEITVRGTLFGQKPPKVWMEYRVDGAGPVKMKKLKVLKPYAYDVGGKIGNSVMDPVSGICEFRVLVPDKLPKGWLHLLITGGDQRGVAGMHDIVVDNGIGIATTRFNTFNPDVPEE